MMRNCMSEFANNANGMMKDWCSGFTVDSEKDFEVVRVETTKNECSLCEDFANEKIQKKTPIAVISCEGACLRGEVARQAANQICFDLLPDQSARICLGAAFTKNTGQRKLVRNTSKILVLEGCSVKCATRMMKGVIDGFNPEIILVDKLYDFDKELFGINEVTEQQIKDFSSTAATKIVEKMSYTEKSLHIINQKM